MEDKPIECNCEPLTAGNRIYHTSECPVAIAGRMVQVNGETMDFYDFEELKDPDIEESVKKEGRKTARQWAGFQNDVALYMDMYKRIIGREFTIKHAEADKRFKDVIVKHDINQCPNCEASLHFGGVDHMHAGETEYGTQYSVIRINCMACHFIVTEIESWSIPTLSDDDVIDEIEDKDWTINKP